MKTEKTTACLSMEKMDNRPFNSVGSSRIRVRWLLNYWPEAEEYVIGKKYDVHVYQKVYWGDMMKNFEGIKILDLCDPDWLEDKPVFEFIDLVDAVTTSTQALADFILKIRPEALVKCIPDRVYLPECKPIKTMHKGLLKKIVWFGYHHNTHYLNSTFDELIKRGITLTIISDNPMGVSLAYRNRLKVNNIPYDQETVFKELVRADAVLMPKPRGDDKGKFKSNNKIIQSMALGLPVVIEPEDLDRLEGAEERAKESVKGLKEVKEKWSVEESVKEMRAIIEEIKERKRKKA